MSRKQNKNKALLAPLASISPDVVAFFVIVGFICFYVAGSLAANASQG